MTKQAAQQPTFRGSILDADPPAYGVNIAGRMTVFPGKVAVVRSDDGRKGRKEELRMKPTLPPGASRTRAQAVVRRLSPGDFNCIIALGLQDSEPLLPRVGDVAPPDGFHEEQAHFEFVQTRERVSYLSSRIVRDRIFRCVVLRAYSERCAVSGLKLINGGVVLKSLQRISGRWKRMVLIS